MNAEQTLSDTFRASERLWAGRLTSTDTDAARARICARLQEAATAPDVQEFQCTLKNDWEVLVLLALLKRYDLKPYRYNKQRKSTVLVRVSKRLMNELLLPIFHDVQGGLYTRFNQLTTSLIAAMAPGPYSVAILNHDHDGGALCENCQKHLREGS